ncbi:galactose mutarotase-like domain-containing protein [Mycena rosella]|uniref:Glucose-6-phosphate 1-epimerase n=1 Tax=Mycena rosella TaxID=1033263 RepID=A0AAD7D2C9_MYCRO|nr:galactose mutarotase-like domain-containing protein [Mycena rosella]
MPIQKGEKIVVLEKNGASAEIYLYGATVSSWKSGGVERFWMSGAAVLDGSAPIRGGIPIGFPIFANDVHPEFAELGGAHGFARINVWTLDDVVLETEADIKATFRLVPNDAISKLFPHPFELVYEVTLTGSGLTTVLHIINPASTTSKPWQFNTVFHTYYKVPQSLKASISPLQGTPYIDRLDGMKRKVQESEKAFMLVETASAYDLSAKDEFEVLFSYGDDATDALKIVSKGFPDAVFWNPREVVGSTVPDMSKGGWNEFICWEPGVISNLATLKPGDRFTGVQHMEVVSM